MYAQSYPISAMQRVTSSHSIRPWSHFHLRTHDCSSLDRQLRLPIDILKSNLCKSLLSRNRTGQVVSDKRNHQMIVFTQEKGNASQLMEVAFTFVVRFEFLDELLLGGTFPVVLRPKKRVASFQFLDFIMHYDLVSTSVIIQILASSYTYVGFSLLMQLSLAHPSYFRRRMRSDATKFAGTPCV